MPDEAFRKVLTLLKTRFHVDLAHYKLTTIRRRVDRRMSLSRFERLSAYAEHLRSHPEELKELHDDLFIHVTQFFRDAASFQALKELAFPALLKDRGPEDKIRVWVPGCSTGEEAYSLAMALTEFLEERRSGASLQVFATDISEGAIQQARKAVYAESLLAEMGPSRRERFFEKVHDGYKIRKELRDRCIISRHDVTSNPPFAKLDVISCRNVLIYFGAELQKRILPIFHYALKPAGFLWLGHSETPGASSKLFSLVDKQNKIYAKVPTAPSHLQLPSTRFRTETLEFPKILSRDAKAESEFQRSADQLVLLRYGPPGVVIDANLDILQFRGKTSPFLEPPPGQPTSSLLKMAHQQLLAALRPLVQSAKKQNRGVRKEGVILKNDGARQALNLEVVPLNPLSPERERQFLVLFEASDGRANAAGRPERLGPHEDKPQQRAGKRNSKEQYVQQLQQELDAVREYQQTLVEQFESSQEELTSANEEMQATNEEFQSTNEELETAKEELQSANEELTTMNDELQSRNAELVAVNEKLARGEDRFRLMVEGVKDYAIYMLDPEGRVTSWNEGARRLKGYEASEILGENHSRFFPPEDVAASAPAAELERARIDGQFEAEGWRIRKDGSRFWANVVVTRINDSSGALIGFSKVTRDLTEPRQSEEALEKSEQRFRLMIAGVREYAIFMLDPEGRVASWNEGARRLKGYDQAEIVGKHFSVFYTREDAAAGKTRQELETAAREGQVEEEGWRVRKDGTRFWANVVITRVNDAQGKLLGFTKVTRDLTEQRQAEQALRAAQEDSEVRVQERTKDLAHALRARDEFLSIASHELKTPLTGLKLQLQMAKRAFRSEGGSITPDQVATTCDRALKQAVALEGLIEDLLDISRIQTGRLKLEPKDVNVSQLIGEVAARFSAQLAQSSSTIELQLDSEVVGHWDEGRIAQVLVNLISNAIKYAPNSPIRIRATREEEQARIVVEDSGPGIIEENQETIFERFERGGASPNVGGLGLGLFIARRIIQAHHGNIHVESKVGQGTRFVIEVPLNPPEMDLHADLADD